MENIRQKFYELPQQTQQLILSSAQLEDPTAFQSLAGSILKLQESDTLLLKQLTKSITFVATLNKPDIKKVDRILVDGRCPGGIPQILRGLWIDDPKTQKDIVQNKTVLQLWKEIGATKGATKIILSEGTKRVFFVDKLNSLVSKLESKNIQSAREMNIEDIHQIVKENTHNNGQTFLALRCSDIQVAIYNVTAIHRQLTDLKNEIYFRGVKVLKIFKISGNTLLPTNRSTIFGVKVKAPSLFKDYVKLIDQAKEIANECADIATDLRNVKMNAINTLLKTKQTFGSLLSRAEYIRKRDRIRQQNLRRDSQNRIGLFKKFPLDIVLDLKDNYGMEYIIIGKIALNIDVAIERKKKQFNKF